MKKSILAALSISMALLGMLIYAWHREWLVIKLPTTQHGAQPIEQLPKSLKKKVMLHYWHNNKWQREATELIWSEDTAKTLDYMINNWLSLLDEEQIMDKKVVIQTVLITQSHNAYISFDRNPFNKEQTTFEKLLWLEGLLKTIRENGIALQGVSFLVQHQPLLDAQLDFSNPWPLNGLNGH